MSCKTTTYATKRDIDELWTHLAKVTKVVAELKDKLNVKAEKIVKKTVAAVAKPKKAVKKEAPKIKGAYKAARK
jgi:hypothetical protein